jgi:hypothetical protein
MEISCSLQVPPPENFTKRQSFQSSDTFAAHHHNLQREIMRLEQPNIGEMVV